MSWLAFDIGGANIKVADGNGYTAAAVFPLWKNSRLLAQELRTLITESPPCSHLAITMTGTRRLFCHEGRGGKVHPPGR